MCDPLDPLSCVAVRRNKQDLSIARACTPDGDEQVEGFTSRVAVRLGTTQTIADRYIDVGLMLQAFPRLGEHLSDGHMPFDTVRRMATYLECVPEEAREIVESELLASIAPTSPQQHVPGYRWLNGLIQRITRTHCPAAQPRDEDERKDPDEEAPLERDPLLWVDARKEKTTTFLFTVNKADAHHIQELLRSVMSKEGLDRSTAFHQLLTGKSSTEVTLNIYRPVNEEDGAQVNVAGHWLHALVSSDWMARVTHVAAPGFAKAEGYQTTEGIRASVHGRDGHCRFPGCTVPEHRCDLDHVRRTKALAESNVHRKEAPERWLKIFLPS